MESEVADKVFALCFWCACDVPNLSWLVTMVRFPLLRKEIAPLFELHLRYLISLESLLLDKKLSYASYGQRRIGKSRGRDEADKEITLPHTVCIWKRQSMSYNYENQLLFSWFVFFLTTDLMRIKRFLNVEFNFKNENSQVLLFLFSFFVSGDGK